MDYSDAYWSSAEIAVIESGGVPTRATIWYYLEYLANAGAYLGIALVALGIYMAAKPEPRFPPPPPPALEL